MTEVGALVGRDAVAPIDFASRSAVPLWSRRLSIAERQRCCCWGAYIPWVWKACDEWWRDTGVQLIAANLPDATAEEAEHKAQPRLRKPLPMALSSNRSFGVCRQLTAQEVAESFLQDWPDVSCGFPVSDSAIKETRRLA